MHLQIRKKEKYLLIAMIWYLVIISSALFLMFSPVNAYTLLGTFDHPNTTAGAALYGIELRNYTMFNAGVTRITASVPCYSSNASFSVSGSQTVTVSEYRSGPIRGNWSVTWSNVGHNNLDYNICQFEIIPENNIFVFPSGAALDMYWPGQTWTYWSQVSGLYAYGTTNATGQSVYDWMFMNSGNERGGVYKSYGGTALPDPPVINDVMLDEAQVCLQPNESAALISDVTGTVDTWIWQVLDSKNNVVSNTSDPVMTVTAKLQDVGNYTVRLTVINSGGSDSMDNTTAIRVNQPGTCNFTPYNPFPTISTTPTQNVYATMTMPPSVLVNMSGVNDVVNNSYLGNWSLAYRQDVDRIGEGFNTTLVGVVSIVQSPLTMVVNGIAEGVSLFSVSVNSLMSYTTIPLAIVGITLSYYPWQIITLITAGIAVDALFVLVFGVR